MLAYVTGSVDQELLLRNQYLATENRILRQQIRGRVILSDVERFRLARIAKQLSRKALAEVAQIVRPETLLVMAPAADRQKVRWLQQSLGSPAQFNGSGD